MADTFLTETDWRDLLRAIHARKVIPVVGPGLVTLQDPINNQHLPLYKELAPKLARQLGLADPDRFTSLNDAARTYLLIEGKPRDRIYNELRELLDNLAAPPSSALLNLAAITGFDLFISSTPDPLLAQAVARSRPGFSLERNVMRFHPSNPIDLDDPIRGPLVYHILGDYNTYPDFAVWEEDYMEFICGLLEKRNFLEILFRTLRDRYLLLLGAPSEDWIVRFFLRAARGERLSISGLQRRDYLADHRESLSEPMIFFFDKAVRATRIIVGSPADFVSALATRWRDKYSVNIDAENFLRRMPETMPRGSVFISYSRDDIKSAVRLALALAAGGVPVWLDRQRLQPGENFGRSVEAEVKDGCSFFVALISQATERDPNRFVHLERGWAAQKYVDGFVYYLPVIVDLDENTRPQLEPPCFANIHRERLSDDALPDFVARVKTLVDEFQNSGHRPRG